MKKITGKFFVFCKQTKKNRTDYEDIDSYYKDRGYLIEPAEYFRTAYYIDIFPEEIQFLRLKYTITNKGKMEKTVQPFDIEIVSKSDNGQYTEKQSYFAADGRYIMNGIQLIELNLPGKSVGGDSQPVITLQPETSVEIEFIGEFMGYYSSTGGIDYNYDLYLNTGTAERNVSSPEGETIHLNIVRKNEDGTDITYDEVRHIQDMKCRTWTNLEMAETLREGDLADMEQGISPEEISLEEQYQYTDRVYWCGNGDETLYERRQAEWINNAQLIDWTELPQIYGEQGNLQKMAERYKSNYGYETDELRVLLLDITFAINDTGMIPDDLDEYTAVCFYEKSYLLTRDDTGKLLVFGTADDWRITSNSRNQERDGMLNLEWLGNGDAVTVQMAYILPPDVFEHQNTLYFRGGDIYSSLGSYDIPVTKIELE